MSVRMIARLGTGVAAMVAVAQGCRFTEPNPRHCNNNDGDEYCNRELGDELTTLYCERGTPECRTPGSEYGCVAERPADECYSPCGGRSTIAEHGECLMVEDSSSGTSSGTETESSGTSESSSSTTGPMPCVNDEECTQPDAPFCGVTGECGTCEGTKDPDGACAGVDPLLPLCVLGDCVACTPENPAVCDTQLLLCDGTTNACVPCTEHALCGSGACELAVGTCFPPDVVVHVDDDGGQDFTSIGAAVASIAAGMHGVIVVHAIDNGDPYLGGVTIDGDKVVALFAAPGEQPILQGTGGNPGLSVEGAGTILYTDGLSVSGNTGGLGLRVNDAIAWVDRSRIVQNTGGGVLAENGAELTLRNCFVGGSNNNVNAVQFDGASAEIVYTTLTSGFAAATALSCNAPIEVSVRNSILLIGAASDAVVCPEATITDSATEDLVGAFDGTQDWFTDYFGAELALTPTGALVFADIAVWQAGDPLTDIDDDPRPTIDGTPDYAGADVPQ